MPTFLHLPMLLLVPALLLFLSTATTTGATTKVYQHNKPVAPSRPADAPDVDYGGIHPFDDHRHLHDASYANNKRKKNGVNGGLRLLDEEPSSSEKPSSSEYKTTAFNPTNDHLYQPLRIQFDARQLIDQMYLAIDAGDDIAATKLYLLIYEILPMTSNVWGDILRVIPVTGGIYPLAAKGSGVDQLLPNQSNNENDAVTDDDRFYVDPVRAKYCPDETTSGIEGGADLLIYATVNRHCAPGGGESSRFLQEGGGMGTLASALSCQRDQYDRPITGSIDFCLEGMRGVTQYDVASRIESEDVVYDENNYLVGSDGGQTMKWDGWGSKEGVTGTSGKNRDLIQYSVGVAVHGE